MKNNDQAFSELQMWNTPEGVRYHHKPGMSKRYFTACMAMNAIISSGHLTCDSIVIVEQSYKIADEMLKQEDEE